MDIKEKGETNFAYPLRGLAAREEDHAFAEPSYCQRRSAPRLLPRLPRRVRRLARWALKG